MKLDTDRFVISKRKGDQTVQANMNNKVDFNCQQTALMELQQGFKNLNYDDGFPLNICSHRHTTEPDELQ